MSKLLTVYAVGGGMLGLTLILTVFAQCFWQTSQGDRFDWNSVKATSTFRWQGCYKHYQCTRLKVPMNYTNPSSGWAGLAIIRVPSLFPTTSPSYQGPLIINPGGPGGSGVSLVLRSGFHFSTILDGRFDIIGLDPRGIGRSTPQVKFFGTYSEQALWLDGEYPDALNSSTEVLPRSIARAQLMGHLAEDQDDGTLRHVTTENIARDMLSIARANGNDKLQYWGFSWGTILGVVFATLFPDHVGRMVLDGVIDAEDYYATLWSNNLLDTNKTLQHFFQACVDAGPTGCAFYAPNATEIASNLDRLYDMVKAQPVPVYQARTYGLVDYSLLRRAVFTALYSPFTMFEPLAQGLADLKAGNGDTIYSLVNRPRFECADAEDFQYSNQYESGTALHCLDGDEVHDSPAELRRFYEKMTEYTTLAELWAVVRIRCSGWRVRTKRTLPTKFGGRTSSPLLLVSNTADPVAPLWAAHKTSKWFPGSVVLMQDAPGHCSVSAVSSCTQSNIREYLLNGNLPNANATVCAVDEGLFKGNKRRADTEAPSQQLPLVTHDTYLNDIRRLRDSFPLALPT
ncbi:alpha/beta-hydrolase [Pleurotus eryngii]|uniref:Alpha/beta-hydrolase n=1 Tax=Pleurotus eryngii TaxID=5323 RepID=A0A9P6DI47_PLEER|nr:alpha/beta-hydrolase [Pleurotus eryngii]